MLSVVGLDTLEGKTTEEVLELLGATKDGLSEGEAKRRLAFFGPNELDSKKKLHPLQIFFSKFKNPVLLMLILAAILSGFLGSAFNSIIIMIMVLGSVLIDFVNTYRSERTAEDLREQVKVTAEVWRSGEVKEKKIRELVPGDLISLGAGDLVPADSFLLEGKDLFVNESAITGESLPVEKRDEIPTERLLWMGTSVVSGSARAVVGSTGKNTKFGNIATHLAEPEILAEFDRNLKDFSFFIFRLILFLVLAIIFVNIFFLNKEGPLEIFLFAVAIAVGLAPELLPLIVTTNLAKGAIKMSRHGVIVKKLSAIHDFGSMDVLCTDKTGTLTENKISLIKYVDGFGKDNDQVLFWGYLSSIHVTGIHGILDKAIQDFRKIDVSGYEKIDELPFDFERKRDSVVVQHGDESILISKGAPEEIYKVSFFYGGTKRRFTKKLEKKINAEYLRLSNDGFRVLGLATKKFKKRNLPYTKKDESRMTFLGYLAFLDPPKHSAKATLERLRGHHVQIKIITGDNQLVTEKIARELELPVEGVLSGDEIKKVNFQELKKRVENVSLFTRLSPMQKEEVVRALRENGHVVGYLGDGVNDVLPLKAADVGISVNNAVDIAKETADLILVNRGLGEIMEGVAEGRKTFANIFKYLMMSLSSNFGNMISMPFASLFLPFLPMTASQILLTNFLYDTSQLSIPFDRVDEEFLKKAKRFDLRFMKNFMAVFGPLSSLFDVITFAALFYVFGFAGAAFQTGWFLESIATQTIVVNSIRTRKPFWKSVPSMALLLGTFGIMGLGWFLPYTIFGHAFDFIALPSNVLFSMALIVIGYLLAVEFVKKYFYEYCGHLIER